MMQIGITGGIGSGKSTVCKVFASMGFPIYDSDERAKAIVDENEELKVKIIDLLGNEAYDKEGKYNRGWVASKVFNDDRMLKSLNGLIHPAVGNDYNDWLKLHESDKIVFKESAILIETGIYKSLNYTINVTAPIEERIRRILKRDSHRSKEQIMSIIAKQIPDDEKNSLVNYVIVNDGKASIIKQVNMVLEQLHKVKNIT